MFLPEETIEAVWEVSAAVITEALLREEQVIIRRFGVFRRGKTGTAKFKSAVAIRQILKESVMEKYGVDIDNEAMLMAKVTGECPACKSPLESKDPPRCPKCGTAPFEKKPINRHNSIENIGKIYGKANEEE